MIYDDDDLQQTREAAACLERCLDALNKDRKNLHPDRYALMANPVLGELRKIRHEIDSYLGITEAIQAAVPLWLKLDGPDISLEDAPSSLITSLVDSLRVGVQTVAEYLTRGVVGGRPTAKIKEACEFRLAAWQPGSIQVGLELPELIPELFTEMDQEIQRSLFEEPDPEPEKDPGIVAREALQVYLKGASWVGSDEDTSQLDQLFTDKEELRVVLNQIARMLPAPRGVLESVEFSGRSVPGGAIRLGRESRKRARNAITESLGKDSEHAEGVIREIDLDNQSFILRNPDAPVEVRCSIPDERIDLVEIVRSSLDRRATVVGFRSRDKVRGKSSFLEIQEIEIVDTNEYSSAE